MPLPTAFPAFIYKRGEGVSSGVLVHSAEEIPAGDWVDAPTVNDGDRFSAHFVEKAPKEAAVDDGVAAALQAEIETKDKIIADQAARIAELEAIIEGIGDAADQADAGVDTQSGETAPAKPPVVKPAKK